MPAIAAVAIGAGASLLGGKMQSDAAKKSAQAAQAATDQSSATQRYIFDTIRNDTATQRSAGDAATRQIAAIMGLNLTPNSTAATQPIRASGQNNALSAATDNLNDFAVNPLYYGANALQDGGYSQVQIPQTLPGTTSQAASTTQTDPTAWLRSTPGYQFNYDEGMRALNAGLASRGQLFSGDAGREAIRYGQNYGDRIYNQERNALFNLAGMGQVSQGQSNQAGQNYANNITNLNTSNANALGSSYQNSANAWTNALGGAAGAGLWALGRY